MADTVLIVDDDEAVLTMLRKVMRSSGIDSEVARSGKEAIELAGRGRYNLMLLDVNMPGMDGFEVIQALRGRGVKLPIVIVSGRKEDYDALYGLDIGADDYLTKPFNPVTLGAKVKALIRRSRGGMSGSSGVISAGPFRYDTSTLRFYKDGREIVLSSKENAIMKLFLDNVDRIFTKDMICHYGVYQPPAAEDRGGPGQAGPHPDRAGAGLPVRGVTGGRCAFAPVSPGMEWGRS